VCVCRAVEHAHRSLIVHRDLKPSNILVSTEGEVKLLDFGIAKLLDAATADAPKTELTSRLMTPAYASPEQVRGDAVTTATDVYGLGLVLYELLCGRQPFRLADTTPLAVAQAVLHTEAPPPSRHASGEESPGPEAEGIARDRSLSPERLRRALTGDLDAITLCALRKEPGERYASAASLREDLERWLAGRPVAARRGTAAYRARKFARRHRVSVGLGLLVAASVVAGLAAALWQAAEARRAEAKAVAVSEFLVEEMIGAAAPDAARGRAITVREVLDATALRVPTAFPDQPEVAAAVRSALGRAYAGLGAYEAAVEHLETAAGLVARERGPTHPEALRARSALGSALVQRGDYDRAAALLGETLQAQRRAGADSRDALVTQGRLADLDLRRGDYLGAERGLREVADRLATRQPGAWRERLRVLASLVRVLDLQRKNSESEALCLQTLELQRARLGPDHPDVVRTLSLLGQVQRRLQHPRQAVDTLEQARTLAERVLGPEHPETLDVMRSLGAARWDRGDSAGSLELFTTTVERARRGLGPDHPATLDHVRNLAVVLKRLGRPGDAEPLYRDLIERCRRTLGEEHPSTVRAITYLGELLWATGRRREAVATLREVVAIGTRQARRPDADATALNDFADLLLFGPAPELHDPGAALPLAERAVAATGRRQVEFLATLGQAHHRLGQLDRAIEVFGELHRLPDSVYRPDLERYMIGLLKEKGDPQKIERFLRDSLARRRRLRAGDDPLIALSLRLLGLHHLELGRAAEAESELREALAQLGRSLPESDWRVGRARSDLGAAAAAQGRFEEAEGLLAQGYAALEADPRAQPEDRREPAERLVRLYEAWGREERTAAWRARLREER
jgi:serine/threonine-protein kinase